MSTSSRTYRSLHPPPTPNFSNPVDGKTTDEVMEELWSRHPRLVVERNTLFELFAADTRNPVIHLPGALPREYCANAVCVAAELPFEPYAKTTGSEDFKPIVKFGPTVFDWHGASSFDSYFADGASAQLAGSVAFAKARMRSPLELALRALSTWPGKVDVAMEKPVPNKKRPRYFAGVIRDIQSGALPHVDDAATETPELIIGKICAQITLLFYLDVPAEGGSVRVYDKRPDAEDYRNNVLGYGFSPDAVRGASFKGITPDVGSVVMFRTSQIHAVDPIIGDGHRITWSTFIGLHEDGSLILWS